jgi:hypothetical protein
VLIKLDACSSRVCGTCDYPNDRKKEEDYCESLGKQT